VVELSNVQSIQVFHGIMGFILCQCRIIENTQSERRPLAFQACGFASSRARDIGVSDIIGVAGDGEVSFVRPEARSRLLDT
jgi:hypothetical protein